jgi:hypothetical protein
MSFIVSCLDHLDATTVRVGKPLTKKAMDAMIAYKSRYEPASDIFLARELFEGLVN